MRGHDDSGPIFNCEKDNNDGNFRSLLRFRALSGDLTLKNHLMNSSGKSVYISPMIQNEIIQICGSLIQKEIVLKINQAKFFTILADETCDISRIEQMSLCVRYIDNGCIKEDFLAFIPIYDVSGKGMACTIIREIGKLGIKIENLIGQGYDGASAMSGLYNGVQKHIRDKIPHALYVHCAAHSLNLAIGKSCTIPEIRNCIGSISTIINFFRKSPMRSAVLKEFIKKHTPSTQQSSLIQMCETRWIDRHESVLRFKDLYKVIAYALNDLESNHNLETSQLAFQLSKTHRSSQFIIALYVIEKLFSITLPLCNALQKINCDLSECCENVANCINVVSSIRNNADKEFQNFYNTFEPEFKVWTEKWKNVPESQCPNSAIDTLNKVSVDFFPNIWCLMSILVTLPVSTASSERSFSTLKRLKSYLRNSTSENRLTGLALMSIHRSISIDTQEVINEFANLPRKLDFVL
ncbi:52 kDa repressor of the inhibitor of the protein kinase-like [Melanaphis sacchari]|uniref:52 kDa repressor of the inhibitor of the protein kinase-like n=1 Tax=Melanaphis sacchari TaxID=742174 RepID=UPI000DC13918|nr:52 kDa repressor of the inhibitor of the protein kinase-like [Melanaphis sacchari]